MKSILGRGNVVFAVMTVLGAFLFSTSAHAQFSGVSWTRDYNNSPHKDSSGSGVTPSTSGATNKQSTVRFKITSSSTGGGRERQEWQYERRSGFVQMQTEFRISTSTKNFNKIALAQNHDDKTGSAGVFSIYQVRKSGNSYYFGVQGDTTEASNSYSKFSKVKIQLGKYYRLKLRSYINGVSGSVEVAELYEGSRRIWRETVRGGGDNEGYYKIGVYRLTGGKGPITADFKRTRFWTGRK